MPENRKIIKAPFQVIVIFIALTVIGLAFIPKLSLRLNPSRFMPSLTVECYWHNASPENMEREVTSLIEGAVSMIKGVEKVSSVSSKGRASVTVTFDKYADMDEVRFETATAMHRIYGNFPEQVTYPQITMNRPDDDDNDRSLISYTLNGPEAPWRIQKYAEDNIKKRLSEIAGVDRISVYGASPVEWQVLYNPDILQTLHISTSEIAQAINNFFAGTQVGYAYEIRGDAKNYYTVNIVSPADKPEWSKIPVKKTGQRVIYLTDIATVKQKERDPSSYYRINGLNTINLVVYPVKGANNIIVASRVKAEIENIGKTLPTGYELFVSYDSTEYIKDELTKISRRTAFTIVILLLFVLIISLSFRYLFIILIGLLSNISISFALYYFLGIEIHLYSLAGVTISLGLIIDNTIVMIDHIRHKGNIKVFTALLASTLTTIAALTIIWFLPENIKLNLWDFAGIIIVNLAVSLVISLFFIPALLYYIPLKSKSAKTMFRRRRLIVKSGKLYERTITFLLNHRVVAIIVVIIVFGLPVFLLPNKLEGDKWYDTAYNKTLGSDWYIENARPWVNKILGGSLRLFVNYVYEGYNYSRPEQTKLYVSASMPKGSTLGQMNEVYLTVENYLSQFPEIDKYITRISSPQNASMSIFFKKEFENSSFPYILKARLISRSLDLGGISWNIYGVGKGFSNSTGVSDQVNYRVSMYGYNYDELYRQALKLKAKLLKHPRIKDVDVTGGKYWWERYAEYEYILDVDKEKLALHKTGLPVILAGINRFNTSGGVPLSLFAGKDLVNINIKPDSKRNTDVWNIMNTPIDTSGFKLKEFAGITKQRASQSIYKENQNYLRLVKYNYLGSFKFGNKYLEKVLNEMKDEMPLGYYAEKSTYYWLGDEVEKQYGLLLIVIALIFMICAVLFESLRQPLAIVIIIPLSFTGIFLTFYWFDFSFDQGGYASFVLLSGLVVNSAIYIINEFNALKRKFSKRNIPMVKLYRKAFDNKIIPILLTILSTILGLLPFVLYGGNDVFWFALAAGSIGGLLFSLIVIVIYLPLFVVGRKVVNTTLER